MTSMFPECFFYIVNVMDIPGQDVLRTELVTQTSRYKIIEISFNDAHDKGRDKSTNPDFWLGNVRIWEHIMLKHFHVKGQNATKTKDILRRIKSIIKSFLSRVKKMIA